MKTLLATAALAVAVSAVSPASAQSQNYQRWPGLGAFAQDAPMTAQQRRNLVRSRALGPDGRMHSSNPAYDVYDGRYISSDPDPFIRNELLRDPPDRVD